MLDVILMLIHEVHAALEYQHFFFFFIKCRGNYMKIHIASALSR